MSADFDDNVCHGFDCVNRVESLRDRSQSTCNPRERGKGSGILQGEGGRVLIN